MESKEKKVCWILKYGRDCDGHECTPDVYSYSNKEEAIEECDDLCEASDGVSYVLTENYDEVVDFCNHYDITI